MRPAWMTCRRPRSERPRAKRGSRARSRAGSGAWLSKRWPAAGKGPFRRGRCSSGRKNRMFGQGALASPAAALCGQKPRSPAQTSGFVPAPAKPSTGIPLPALLLKE